MLSLALPPSSHAHSLPQRPTHPTSTLAPFSPPPSPIPTPHLSCIRSLYYKPDVVDPLLERCYTIMVFIVGAVFCLLLERGSNHAPSTPSL